MEEIGRRLQAARLAKGLSLQDVEDETRIRKKYIEALENGRPALIPGEVYVKGFLRTYAKHLGLDGEAMVEEYKLLGQPPADPAAPDGAKAEKPAAAPRATEAERVRRPAVSDAQAKVGRPAAAPRPREGSDPSYGLRRVAVGLVVLVPLAGLIWWGYGALNAPKPPKPPAVQQTKPSPAPAPAPTPTPAPAPAKPTVTMTPAKGQNVAFTVSTSPVVVQMEGFREGFPWMAVTADGKELFSGKPGGPVKYEGRSVTLRVGYMDGIDLVINGERFAQPLKSGPFTITITGQ